MFFRRRGERKNNWDYRDYCDPRTRQKRRVRSRLAIMSGLLLACLLVIAGLGAAKGAVWAQIWKVHGKMPYLVWIYAGNVS